MTLLVPVIVTGRAAEQGRAETALALGRIGVVRGVGVLWWGIWVAVALRLWVVRVVGWLLLWVLRVLAALGRVAALLAVLVGAAAEYVRELIVDRSAERGAY